MSRERVSTTSSWASTNSTGTQSPFYEQEDRRTRDLDQEARQGKGMSFEFYVLACNVLMAFGFGMLLQNLSRRISDIEKRLNMEDEDADQED